MIQIRNNEGIPIFPKINGTFSNISKSFEEDLYSQQNPLIHYKNDNASYSYYRPSKESINHPNILKPNIFFTNHEDDGIELRLPNAISTNLEYTH